MTIDPQADDGEGASPASLDAWAPAAIAQRVESIGVSKAEADAWSVLLLAILAGAFVSLGGLFYTVAVTGSTLGFGATRMLGGLAFSLGLVLVVIAGAELFTGNNLVAMAWASGRIRGSQLLRNWALVYLGNVIGALATVALVLVAGSHRMDGGQVGETAVRIALAKAGRGPVQALALGAGCNALVCLAVWLSIGSRSVTDKTVAVIFPVTAFVTVGFEHSIANWFFLPWGLGVGAKGILPGAVGSLALVTLGNILGGTVLVAGVYWFAYLRPGLQSDVSRKQGP